ncbi:CopG family transcriptional regulator [Sphingomonas sp. IC-56]|uniref:CopG family ribbon-helix-helix protein n=1 Tax=Sphingomonas sp. IC-56 TaxID=2898529 RepID=UPI001E5DC7A8|nr:CopG family transcriptional regulator [Sphingomonas sp. IC-56]MCD2323658.1 CopG family transcriptional regulator [Sphingomonas sp. IC-56]
MNKPAAITAHVDADTLAMVEELAAAQGRSVADFAAEVIQRVAESEADYRAFIQAGIDAADRGEFVSHEDVMAELDAMIERHEARCRG